MPLIVRSFLEGEGGGGGSMHVDTLTITTQPTKKTYIQGEKIDTTGMVVTASAYGMSGTVTPYVTVSPQTLSTAGTQTITVFFGDAEATYTVTVEEIVTLSISTQPTKTAYIQGETLELTGIVVTATSANLSRDVTSVCSFTPANGTPLDDTGEITITASLSGASDTTTVMSYAIESVDITTQPTKTAYIQGETLDLTGIVVTATAGTIIREVTDSCTFSPANGSTLSTTGSITVTASMGGLSDTTTVTSYAIESIAITTPPTKTSYGLDEALDLTGIVVTASANSGAVTQNVTSECTFSPANGTVFTEEGTFTITATYSSFTATTTVEVSTVGTLEGTSWNKIKSIGAIGEGANYWSIGDTKTIALNGTVGNLQLTDYQCKVFIIDFNYRGDNGIYFQGFKTTDETPVNIALKGFPICVRGSGNYGGWKGCDCRYEYLGSTDVAPSGYGSAITSSRIGYDATSTCATNPVPNTLMSALPSDLRAVIAPWTIYTDNVAGGKGAKESSVTSSVDYLPLLAEYEAGKAEYSSTYERAYQATMAYYTASTDLSIRNRYAHDNLTERCYWWYRTPLNTNTDGWVVWEYNSQTWERAHNVYGLAPAFRVA